MERQITQLQALINKADRITFFTGAGISTESGIPDFRSQNGLYKQHKSFSEVVSRSFFERKPEEFWPLFKEIFRIKLLHNYKPNSGHQFISDLEKNGKKVHVITQNVDGLHQKAGSTNVYEIHGTIKNAFCPSCSKKYDIEYINNYEIPRCASVLEGEKECKTILKPGVALFGDNIHHFEEAVDAAVNSDLFIVLGSSLEVSPVNQIPLYVRQQRNIPMCLINRDVTNYDHIFDLVIYDSIGKTALKLQSSL